MNIKKDFMPIVYEFKNVKMEKVHNTNLFNSYLKTTKFEQVFNGTLCGLKDLVIFLIKICWFGVIILIIEC